jgi:hypothetical protein
MEYASGTYHHNDRDKDQEVIQVELAAQSKSDHKTRRGHAYCKSDHEPDENLDAFS